MTQASDALPPLPRLDYDNTLVLAIELSNTSWVLAAQVPGLPRVKAKQSIEPTAEALLAAIDGYRDRARAAGRTVERVVAIYEASWSGFWLARWLARRGVETHVVQPSSVPVDRRARRAKSDGIDAELLLRTLLAWLRGEPRVCSMVPIPDEADEDERRRVREREELVAERVSLVNRIGAVLATLGVRDYNPLRRDRRRATGRVAHGARGSASAARPRQNTSACSTAWSWCARRSPNWSESATRCSKTRPPTKRTKMIQQLAELRGDRCAERHRAGPGGVRARIRQRQGARFLRRAYGDAVQQRRHGARTRDRQGRESAVANRDGRVGLALATIPTRLGSGQLVPRARWRHGSPHAQGHGGGDGTAAADRSCGGSRPRALCRRARCMKPVPLSVDRLSPSR